MKKTIILTWLMLIMAFAAMAAENGVFMEFHRMSKPGKHTQVNRAPMRLPIIEVTYDTDAKTVQVIGDESIDAEVFIYNSVGDLVDYSAYLNTTLSVATSGIYTICIQGNGWYAEGKISV